MLQVGDVTTDASAGELSTRGKTSHYHAGGEGGQGFYYTRFVAQFDPA